MELKFPVRIYIPCEKSSQDITKFIGCSAIFFVILQKKEEHVPQVVACIVKPPGKLPLIIPYGLYFIVINYREKFLRIPAFNLPNIAFFFKQENIRGSLFLRPLRDYLNTWRLQLHSKGLATSMVTESTTIVRVGSELFL